MNTEKAIEFVEARRAKLAYDAKRYLNLMGHILTTEGKDAFLVGTTDDLAATGNSMVFWSKIESDLRRYKTQANLMTYGQFYDVPNHYPDRAALNNLFAILFTEED